MGLLINSNKFAQECNVYLVLLFKWFKSCDQRSSILYLLNY